MKAVRWIAAASLGTALALSSAGPAGASVSPGGRFHTSDVRTFDAPGCRLTDIQTLHEDVAGQLVEVNGSIHVDVLMSGTVTFDEQGEHFSGSFTLPFTLYQQPDGSTETSAAYTAVAKGDQGDIAMLHHNLHVTFFAPDRLDVSFSNLESNCS